MKTRSYRMEVNVCDMLETTVYISRKVFEQKLKSLKRQVEESKYSMDEAFIADWKETSDVFVQYTRNTYRATLGTTDIELIEIVCNEGYCIK